MFFPIVLGLLFTEDDLAHGLYFVRSDIPTVNQSDHSGESNLRQQCLLTQG